MKKNILIIILALGSMFIKAECPESLSDSIESNLRRVSLPADNAERMREITALNVELTEREKRLNRLNNLNDIESLRNEVRLLYAKRSADSIALVEQADIIENLKRQMVNIASHILVMPYKRFNIEKIAIPAFKQAEGSVHYEQGKLILDMLEQYRRDIEELVEFIDNVNMSGLELWSLRKDIASTELNRMQSLECYKRYAIFLKKYPKARNIYLYQQIVAIEQELSNPSDTIVNVLKHKQMELNELLKE